MKTLLFWFSLSCISFAQFTPCETPNNIKSVQLFNPQTNDQNPLIAMGQEQLIVSFDDLAGGFKNYYYKITYRNPDWSESSIFESEYLKGFRKGIIQDYKFSFNTFQKYTNYRFTFPNANMQPTLSGNYILTVYDPKGNKPIFCKRFAIFENAVNIGIQVDRGLSQNLGTHQLRVDVNSPRIDLTQNPDGTELVVLKNANWNERTENPTLSFQQPFRFSYNSPDFNVAAGNEYHWLDTKSIQLASVTTQTVQRETTDSLWQTYLYYNLADAGTGYVENPDVNGAFYIRNTEIPNETEARNQADYTWVHFGLEEFEDPKNEYDIYVVGAFNGWNLLPEHKMERVASYAYEKAILLKQGYYNFSYATKHKKTQEISYTKVPGNYWQTENTYQALFYYQPWGERYHRLLGMGEGFSRPSQR